MTDNSFDIGILGNGFTALITGIYACQHGMKVCLFEKKLAARPVEYETISLQCLEGLSQIHTKLSPDQLTGIIYANQNSLSAWGTTITKPFTDNKNFHICKPKLLAHLKIIAEQAGVIFCNAYGMPQYNDKAHQWFSAVEKRQGIYCNLIIDATGRGASFALKQGAVRKFDDGHFAFTLTRSRTACRENSFVLESAANGWWYGQTTEDVIQTVWVTDLDNAKAVGPRRHFSNNYNSTYYIKQLQPLPRAFKLRATDARMSILDRCYGKQWVALGESAATFDPLSGKGNEAIVWMILSCMKDLEGFLATHNSKALHRIDTSVHDLYHSILSDRLEFYAMEKRWPRSSFWITDIPANQESGF